MTSPFWAIMAAVRMASRRSTMLTTFRNCYLLRLPLLFFSTPVFILVRPIVNAAYWVKGLFTRKNNYTSLI